MRMKMPGQMGESDPALPYEKMTLQYDECTGVEENKSIEVKEYLRKIKNHGCGGVPRSQPDPEYADAGEAGLSKMPVHTRGGAEAYGDARVVDRSCPCAGRHRGSGRYPGPRRRRLRLTGPIYQLDSLIIKLRRPRDRGVAPRPPGPDAQIHGAAGGRREVRLRVDDA